MTEKHVATRRSFIALAASTGVGAGLAMVPFGGVANGSARRAVSPEDFGAVGDGVTDDQPAFDALNAWLAANDGGEVVLTAGKTYLAGRQAKKTAGYLYAPERILGADDVSRLIVRGNGATIRFKDGLKFGAFDPATGRPLGSITTERSRAAAIGWAVRAYRVGSFEVHGLKIDCNSEGMEIGGEFGDTGRQLLHAGLDAVECESVLWQDVHVVNSCLDGFMYHYSLTKPDGHSGSFRMRGCSVDRVARNGLSYTGGAGGILEDCILRRAGEAPNPRVPGGSFGSKPKSCIDIEAEQSLIRRFTARGNRFLAGPNNNTCVDVNSGDIAQVLFEDCLFAGRAWFYRPQIVVRKSTFRGSLAKFMGGNANPDENTLFEDCRMSDQPYGDAPAYRHGLFDGAGSGGSPESMARFRRCNFVITGLAVDARFTDIEDSEFSIETSADRLPPGEQVINVTASRWRNVRIQDRVKAPYPSAPFVINGIKMQHRNVQLLASFHRAVRFGPDIVG